MRNAAAIDLRLPRKDKTVKLLVASALAGGLIILDATMPAPALAQTPAPTASATKTPAQQLMGDIAPKLAELTDDVLFGDVWERPGLSKRDRSLVTISALIAMNRPEQLRSHLVRARANGVTDDEMIEVITHLAFYSGWPNAVTAVAVARDALQKK
jgi:4-carboxymuconolactone decarboxylase